MCRTEARVQCRAVVFCQRPVCLASGALCSCLPRAPDTGSVLENRTCSTFPDPAVLCRLAGELTGSTPRPFGSSFLCQLHEGSQATERHRKDKPHRDVSQAAGSLCGDTILFPLHQMSAWQPLHSSWWLCAFFHFSLESPPVQDVFYFTFEKAEALCRAWVTSSRPTAVARPQSFASGSLSLARGGERSFVLSLQSRSCCRMAGTTAHLRRSELLLHSDHLPVEDSWLHMWKKRLIAKYLYPQTSKEEKKLVSAAFLHLEAAAMCPSPIFVSFPLHPWIPGPSSLCLALSGQEVSKSSRLQQPSCPLPLPMSWAKNN